ncbi:MAG: PqqD family protein [Labilithrix sp.]|nr:PqqD family protein [Labilithrix sp.]MCW5833041.1 PqqD family protein [Labilithrix sp.]
MPSTLAAGPETKLRVSPRVYARAFGDEIVLLDFREGEYFGLDAIGAEIWRRIEAEATLGQVADGIVERYDVTRETALRDIALLVDAMRQKGLVEAV